MTAPSRPQKARSPRPSRRKLGDRDYHALGAFRQALRRFLAFSEAIVRAHGLTPQQHQALLAVRAHDGDDAMSVGELADCLLIKNHSALGLVDRLGDRGLLERSTSEADRRRVLLHLTPAGEQILETISRNNLGELKSNMPAFADLLQSLERLSLPAPEGPRTKTNKTDP